jgi:hypothetical protein
MFSFQRINWWTLVGGVGLNLFISVMTVLVSIFLSLDEKPKPFYMQFGPALIMLAVFLLCGLAGFVISRLADDVPLKHAFLSSMGAFVPFMVVGILSLANPLSALHSVMIAIIAVAGGLNGGFLGLPKRHYRPDR